MIKRIINENNAQSNAHQKRDQFGNIISGRCGGDLYLSLDKRLSLIEVQLERECISAGSLEEYINYIVRSIQVSTDTDVQLIKTNA